MSSILNRSHPGGNDLTDVGEGEMMVGVGVGMRQESCKIKLYHIG